MLACLCLHPLRRTGACCCLTSGVSCTARSGTAPTGCCRQSTSFATRWPTSGEPAGVTLQVKTAGTAATCWLLPGVPPQSTVFFSLTALLPAPGGLPQSQCTPTHAGTPPSPTPAPASVPYTHMLRTPPCPSVSSPPALGYVPLCLCAPCRFGNLITKADWSLLSVDEGMASYLEYKCMDAVHPQLAGTSDVLFARQATPHTWDGAGGGAGGRCCMAGAAEVAA
jgi:hypothetical protein